MGATTIARVVLRGRDRDALSAGLDARSAALVAASDRATRGEPLRGRVRAVLVGASA